VNFNPELEVIMKIDTSFLKSGAMWTAILLVLLPIMVATLAMGTIGHDKQVGLPLLAILGICALFGACCLVAVVFAQFGLGDQNQALGLPEGSIRAIIALSLIVLFSIIAIMLYQSSLHGERYEVEGLTVSEKQKVVLENTTRVAAILPSKCNPSDTDSKPNAIANQTQSGGVAPSDSQDGEGKAKTEASSAPKSSGSNSDVTINRGKSEGCFKVVIRVSESSTASDLAKQLLVLVGTLMTSVTSFYFASRIASPVATSKTPVGTAITSVIASSTSIAGPWPIKLQIKGKGLGGASKLRLEGATKTVETTLISARDDLIVAELKLADGLVSGTYSISLLDQDNALLVKSSGDLTITA
jgi:hypothetical protein